MKLLYGWLPSLLSLCVLFSFGQSKHSQARAAQAGTTSVKGMDKSAVFDRYIRKAMDLWRTPGMSIVVVKDDEVVFRKGFGVVEAGKPAPFTTGTVGVCASTTKAMTAVCMENILLQAFPGMPRLEAPASLKGPASEHVYELRSYEGPTEKYFTNKVQMFNKGDEIGLFKRLGFNAVFYASVLAGAHMPNLMYMTSFDDMAAREAHWKTFGADPYWKELSAKPEYQNNVSHIDIVFMHPAPYSDL